MTKEEVEQAFNGISPYYAYKQGIQDGAAYNEESFRREAAKDILCALIIHCSLPCKDGARTSIEYADELIKQLKEK